MIQEADRYLHKALFELHDQNQGLAKEYLFQAFEVLLKENKISSIANEYWWTRFGSVVINLGYGSWLLAVLEEKGYNIDLSPYYTAIQALEIEKQDGKNGKRDAEIYLKNRAVEISEPARRIIEKMRALILKNIPFICFIGVPVKEMRKYSTMYKLRESE